MHIPESTRPTRATTSQCSDRCRRRAFTLLELLVVLALIILLVGLIWVAVGAVQLQARTTTCMNNQRQINMANFGFAGDNNGHFMSPRSDKNYNDNSGNWNDIADCSRGGEEYRLFTKSFDSAGADRVGTVSGARTEFDLAITDGAAWEYIGDLKVYSSPLDPTNRLRSYAINAYVGEICPDNLPVDDIEALVNSGWRSARTLSGLPIPNQTLMTVCEEDHQGGGIDGVADFNLHGWVVKSWTPSQGWWDYPAPWLEEGMAVSFCDGSTSFYRFRKPDLGNILIANSEGGGYHRATYEGDPGAGPYDETNSDWHWFKRHMLPGRF